MIMAQKNTSVSTTLCVVVLTYLLCFLTPIYGQLVRHLELRMRGANVTTNDQYFFSSYKMNPDYDEYIVEFESLANADIAHHILLYGCDYPGSEGQTWQRGRACRQQEQILFAWAKNAPPLKLPPNVGFHVGRNSKVQYIVVQIHYVKKLPDPKVLDYSGIKITLTRQKPLFEAGIFLLAAWGATIPQRTKKFSIDISCRFEANSSINAFGYRVHAHSLSTVITGYKMTGNTQPKLIGKGNPQWPQSFYPVDKPETNVVETVEIRPSVDYLMAKCTYDSSNRDHDTRIGPRADNEMCNFYIMYYTLAGTYIPYHTCSGNRYPQKVAMLPADADVPLPPNPELEEVAHGHHHMGHMGHTDNSGSTADKQGPDAGTNNNVETTTKVNNNNNVDNNGGTKTGKFSDNLSKSRYQLPYRQNVYPRDYAPDFDLDDYYNDVETQRNRNRYRHPSYDYYDNDVNRYPFMSRENSMNSNQPGKSRNRNKIFDALSHTFVDPTRNRVPYQLSDDGLSLNNYQPAHVGKKGHNLFVMTTRETTTTSTLSATVINDNPSMKFMSDFGSQPGLTSDGISSLNAPPQLGQVGGLATDKSGHVYVFHRGSRVWNGRSFSMNNIFQEQNQPIVEDTILIYDKQGNLQRRFGSNMFFMPHGITVDDNNNIWVTDVALHQIMRFPAGASQPDLVLGDKFVPGNDVNRFCKPSDVAVMKSGEFFVSDGYCNNRIMKFNKDGTFIKQFGTRNNTITADGYPPEGALDIPHSLALAEDKGLICVADRENGRIQCFDLEGNFRKQIHHREKFGKRLFAIEYSPLHGGLLFAVNGPNPPLFTTYVQGFIININDGTLRESWNAKPGLRNPHDITVDSQNLKVYVGELNPAKIWQFEFKPDHSFGTTTPLVPSTMSSTPSLSSTTDRDISKQEKLVTDADVTIPIIIGCLLIIPVIIIIAIIVGVRIYKRGQYYCCRRHRSQTRKKFNLGEFLSPHRGFDRLSTEESDHEIDPLDDSDQEEYSITRKA